jgi:hypothetical protein
MRSVDQWSLLRGTEEEQERGLNLAKNRYYKEPKNGSNIMELGVAYLWLRHYSSAYEHFYNVIQKNSIKGDVYFGMAGAAKWSLGMPKEAVSMWHAGLRANYTRTSGLGVRMPMLLFFATIVQPHLCEINQIKGLLSEVIKDVRIKNWPGPIAKMILTSDPLGLSEDTEGTHNSRWLHEFYTSLLQRSQNSNPVFKQTMHRLSSISQEEWTDKDTFPRRLWNEEFFLARYEGLSEQN